MKKQRTLKSRLISAIAKVWMWWEPRQEVKNRCKIRTGWWKCETCKRETERLEIDHIEPVILPKDGFIDWNTYIASKFVTSDKLRGICRECHQQKTKEENKVRRLCKKKKSV